MTMGGQHPLQIVAQSSKMEVFLPEMRGIPYQTEARQLPTVEPPPSSMQAKMSVHRFAYRVRCAEMAIVLPQFAAMV